MTQPRFKCEAVDLDFIKRAPFVFENTVELAAPPTKIFEIFADGQSWPKWFKGIKKVQWTSPEPKGVGTTRTVWLDTATVYEYFLVWDHGKRFAFRFTGASLPLFEAGIEDYILEDLGNGRTRFKYGVYLRPTLPLRLLGFVSKPIFGRMFKEAALGLQRYVAAQRW